MEHKGTGIRNGKLFCFNCGKEQTIPYPMEAGFAAEFFSLFEKYHKKCKKTWVEPSVYETKNLPTKQHKMMWWVENGEHGISSKTMYDVLAGGRTGIINKQEYSHPRDPDDFRRCYLLIKAVPEMRNDIDKMREISPQWRAIADNWDKLAEMLEELFKKKSSKMYDFMKSIGC